jgi:hypothetical protein
MAGATIHVREVEGLKQIADVVGQALGRPVSLDALRTMQRGPHPLVLGWRGNRRRFLRCDRSFDAWVMWWKNAPAPVSDRGKRGPSRERPDPRQLTLQSRVP